MNCSKCGWELSEGATFCPQCGAIVGRNNRGYRRKVNTSFLLNIIFGAIIFIIIGILVGVLIVRGSSKEQDVKYIVEQPQKSEKTLNPTDIPYEEQIYEIVSAQPVTPSPVTPPPATPTPMPVTKSVSVTQSPKELHPQRPPKGVGGYKGEYSTYIDKDYGFECSYPSTFSVYDDGVRLALMSPDGRGKILINAVKISGTPEDDLASYIASTGGNIVTYSFLENKRIAASVYNNGWNYYMQSRYINGIKYSFEVTSHNDDYNCYSDIIEKIHKTLKIYSE